ncbi:MAG: ketosteroid isomerase-like protein [Flavobacteriales bacterium]|jgi:ketosteroid isomerase-like protein
MKNKVVLLIIMVLCSSFSFYGNHSDKDKINVVLDNWHKAAGEAQFDAYFNLMTDDAIFIGTDATENWNKTQFQAFAKPFFDRGKAWSFKAIERHIYVDKSGRTAWFDELLDTQMKICRGSGVLLKVGNDWKIKHYVLSMTVPNDNVTEVVKIKTPIEEALMQKMAKKYN